MAKENRLRVNQLVCSKQQRALFAPISFELSAGEMLLIEGANGSGKTSLLRVISGLSTPCQGEINWQGANFSSLLHYVGHQNGLKLGLTAAENIALMGYLSSQSLIKNNIEEWLPVNCLNKPAYCLSAGQKRKLALSKLFLFPKNFWLLDEPLTARDKQSEMLFLTKLEKHLQQGGMCVATSHHAFALPSLSYKTLSLNPC